MITSYRLCGLLCVKLSERDKPVAETPNNAGTILHCGH